MGRVSGTGWRQQEEASEERAASAGTGREPAGSFVASGGRRVGRERLGRVADVFAVGVAGVVSVGVEI